MESSIRFQQTLGARSSTSWVVLIILYSVLCMWTSVEGWSYHYSNTTMNWEQSRKWCQEHYTDMVAIQDQREIAHLNTLLPREAGTPYYWIGIRKREGGWTWVGTNKTLTAEAKNWATNEPNDGQNNEDCVEIYIKRAEDAGKWNDDQCNNRKRPLCYTAACAKDSCFHGECVETINNHRCECFEGFYGDKCEHVVQCKEEEVTVPDKASHECSHLNGNFSYASTCQYSCEEGYQLSSSGTMRCTASGTWSEPPPTCQLISCPELYGPVKGSMACHHPLSSFSYLSTCGFTCEEGYELASHSTNLQCEASGHWNDSQPQCAAVQCPALQEPENGNVTCGEDRKTQFSYGHSCRFSCEEGFRLQGASMVTCTAAASWSEVMPRCEAVECDLLSQPDDGFMICSGVNHTVNSTCYFGCSTGFLLLGSPEVTCDGVGLWSSQRPYCASYMHIMALAGGGVLLTSCCICFCYTNHRKRKKLGQPREPEEGVTQFCETEKGEG